MLLNKGEVWFVEFPLEENPNRILNRPVVVLDENLLGVLSVKITKHKAILGRGKFETGFNCEMSHGRLSPYIKKNLHTHMRASSQWCCAEPIRRHCGLLMEGCRPISLKRKNSSEK